MIILTVLGAVMVMLMTVMYSAQRSRSRTTSSVESVQAARIALDLVARDVRSAGYGADLDWLAAPQPPIAYVDSLQVLINANMTPWPDALPGVQPGSPHAYNPAGNPRPRPLDGTSWTPPVKYRTGAEIIRWTLDANNDGAVNPDDWTVADGMDAARSRNPGDYVLLRQVFGDSTNNVADNNGGGTERVALIQRPSANGVPPLFTVYLQDSSDPWNWSDGPVPANRLADIERVVVNVTAGSSEASLQNSPNTIARLRTEVSSMRNRPDFGAPTFAVDGTVFRDDDQNGVKNGGEPGIPGATVRLGTLASSTDPTGYFLFRVEAGTYTLRHTPPAGYGVLTQPDSFVVTVGPATTRSFADTLKAGGWVTSFTFDDKNSNAIYDAGDEPMATVQVTLNPGADVKYTDNSGYATNFASVGGYTVSVTPPDSFVATTPNPVSGNMTGGGSASHSFGFTKSAMGTVTGKVFTDINRNGVLEAGEPGIQGVWVGVTRNGGTTVLGYQVSDANGDFSIDVPSAQAPDQPYYLMSIVKPGFFPTNSATIGPFYLADGQTINNNNFGESSYQIITLAANRVLSLASANLIEGDWNGNQTQNARGDTDLILGADATGGDQILTWFNQYNSSPLFNTNPSRSYTAQSSVLCLAADTLNNTATWRHRPDVVTGTNNAAGGNFFVWLNQNTNNNEGYLPATANLQYRTNDMGDVQAVLAYDCAGGGMPDIIVGAKSPTANQGTIEVWQNNDASAVAFTRQEIYPPNGGIPGNALGEVTAMALADFDGNGTKDLVVGTKSGTYQGQLLFFKYVSKVNGNRFVYQCGYSLPLDAVTSIACFDIDGDGKQDCMVGTQRGSNSGLLQQWGNKYAGGAWSFTNDREVSAPGIVLSLTGADLGGSVRGDLVVGYRADAGNYLGGVRIYYCDTGQIPAFGTDPSGGAIVNMVPATTSANFNYGVKPSVPSPPFLLDLATGVKSSASTGALIVFIR
jgi:hypothetical protein